MSTDEKSITLAGAEAHTPFKLAGNGTIYTGPNCLDGEAICKPEKREHARRIVAAVNEREGLLARVAELEGEPPLDLGWLIYDAVNSPGFRKTAPKCVEIAEEVNAWIERNHPLAARVAELEAALEKAEPLLREVIQMHADPECAEYNRCDVLGEKCKWCGDAETALAALAKGGDNE